MQRDAEFKKEQIGTLFVCLGGGTGGGFGGWAAVSQIEGSTPEIGLAFQKKLLRRQ
jgi:hypothetical protein